MKENKSIELITFGPTFEGDFSFLGLCTFVIGLIIVFFPNYMIVGILLIVMGMILFLSLKGVQIDHRTKKVRLFESYLVFRTGSWKPINQFSSIILHYNNQSQTLSHKSIQNSVRTKSFSVSLMDDQKNKFELKELYSYGTAKKFLDEYSQSLNLPMHDIIDKAQLINKLRKKPFRRK